MTFPMELPTVATGGLSFELQRSDFLSPEGSGRVGAVAAGFPLWTMALSLEAMTRRDADQWRAFVALQRGPQRLFLGRDLDRPFPALHRGGRPFAAVATDWTQTIDSEGLAQLELEGLLPGSQLVPVDYIGFRWPSAGLAGGVGYALVRVVVGGVIAGDGTVIVAVEPPVPTIVPADAEAYFHKPSCLMRFVPDQVRLADRLPGYTPSGGQIVAIQDLRA